MQDIQIFVHNHGALVSGLVAVLCLLMIVEFIRKKKGTRRISPQYATQLINHHQATLIDIRNNDVFNAGHIVGAVCIPLIEVSRSKKLEKLKQHPLILVSATEVESERTATTLLKNGFNVYILAGGIRSWKEADLPLVKG